MAVSEEKHKEAGADPGLERMRAELARKIANRVASEGDMATDIESLRLYRRSVATACASAAYEPSLVVFVQGEKRINVGKTTYICDGRNFLLTSVDLPVVSQVTVATEKKPILGLILKLEMPTVREILSQQEFHLREESADARAMAVGVSSCELLDACSRLVALLDTPEDIPFLGGLIQRAFGKLPQVINADVEALQHFGEGCHCLHRRFRLAIFLGEGGEGGNHVAQRSPDRRRVAFFPQYFA